jgi:recombination protein RecA
MPPTKRVTPAKAAPRARKTTPRKTAAPVKAVAKKGDRRRQSDIIAAAVNRDKRFGEGTVVIASDIVVADRWGTGALAFDVAMSGGLPVNQWTEVLGLENSGKTTFILKALAEQQRRDPEYFCVWVASEAFDPDLADKCGVDRTRVYLVEENVMELAFTVALKFIEGRGCDMLVIDSYPAMVTQLEDDKGVDEISMGGAKVLNLFMRKCTKASKRSLTDLEDRPFAGVIVNQWREKIGVLHGDPRTSSGGKGKNYWMYARLDVKRDEWIVNKRGEKVGQAIKIVCIKMKGARPQQVGVADFYFVEHGEFNAGDYDTFKQIVNLALYFDVIGRRGNGYLGPEEQFIKSKDLLIATLQSDAAWRAAVEASVLDLAKRGKAPIEIDEEDNVVDLHVVEDEDAPSKKPLRRGKAI